MHDCLLQIYGIYGYICSIYGISLSNLFTIVLAVLLKLIPNDNKLFPFLLLLPTSNKSNAILTALPLIEVLLDFLNLKFIFLCLFHFIYLCFRISLSFSIIFLYLYLSHLPTAHRPLDHLTTTTRSLFNFLKSGISPEFPP